MKTTTVLCLLFVFMLSTTTQATVWDVDVHNFEFVPATLTIVHGDTVHWHCSVGLHSVHHVGIPSLFGHAIAAAPWDYSFPFNASGDSTFHYICEMHPTLMQGTITVLPLPTITITTPNGNEHWDVGGNHDIIWNSENLSSTVTIAVNRDYPSGQWDTLFTNLPNPPYYGWTVTGPGGDHSRMRVSSDSPPYVSDISDDDFRIILGTITITAPIGGEDWPIGSQQQITWQSANIQHEFNLDLNRDYPNGPWERIYTFFPNFEHIGWIPTGPASTHCRFRVSSWFVPQVFGESPADFSVSEVLSVRGNSPTAFAIPAEYALEQNFPNPFNPTTEITYALPEAGHVTVTVYNLMGQEVATLVNADQTAKTYRVAFDASQLATGIYVYAIAVNDFTALHKMMLIR